MLTANQAFPTFPQTGGLMTAYAAPNQPAGFGSAGGAGGVRGYIAYGSAPQNGAFVPFNTGDSGNVNMAVCLTIRGADMTDVAGGSPFDVAATSNQTTASTSMSFPSVTTTGPDRLIINAGFLDRDANSTAEVSSYANSNLSSVTEQIDQIFNTGAGGGFFIGTGEKASAGSIGNSTATIVSQVFSMWTAAIQAEDVELDPGIIATVQEALEALVKEELEQSTFEQFPMAELSRNYTPVIVLTSSYAEYPDPELEDAVIVPGIEVPPLTLEYTGQGGISFSGTANVLRIRAYSAVGGLVFSGAASQIKIRDYDAAGGIVFSGAGLTIRKVAVTAQGGLTFSGAVDADRVRSYAATGGLVFSGASTVSRARSHAASGGIVFGGEATVSYSAAYEYAPDGGITFGGAANFAFVRAVSPAGGSVFSGAGTVSRDRTVQASGGIVFSGAADVGGNNSYEYQPTGGIVFGGASTLAFARVITASGGLTISGAATASRARAALPEGGIVFSGAAEVGGNNSYEYQPTGGILFGGAAQVNRIRVSVAAGGLTISGAVDIDRIRVVTPSGGINLTGAAGVNRTLIVDSEGGISFGGTANAFSIPVPSGIFGNYKNFHGFVRGRWRTRI
jgi:hypothetical protein